MDEGEAASEELEKESVPPGLLGAFAAPYWFGPRFVSLLEQERGSKAVDEAISTPAVELGADVRPADLSRRRPGGHRRSGRRCRTRRHRASSRVRSAASSGSSCSPSGSSRPSPCGRSTVGAATATPSGSAAGSRASAAPLLRRHPRGRRRDVRRPQALDEGHARRHRVDRPGERQRLVRELRPRAAGGPRRDRQVG